MTRQPPPKPEDLILEMLRDVLARQAEQMGLQSPPPAPPAAPAPIAPALPAARPPAAQAAPATAGANTAASRLPGAAIDDTAPRSTAAVPHSAPPAADSALPPEPDVRPLTTAEAAVLADFEARAAEPLAPGTLPVTLRSLLVALLIGLVLINLPVFGGLALARALPDRQALIVRDGLVLKGQGPEIYVLEDNQKRWISSLDAFEHYGYAWADVRLVDDAFLAQFPDGRPLHVLLKCHASPDIYRLESGQKRWIRDIPTFTAEGHVWEDVRFVDCRYLSDLPDGSPIPAE